MRAHHSLCIAACCVPLQVLERTVSIHTMKDGNMDECLLEEVVAYRQFTMQEVDLLATLTGMEVRHVPSIAHNCLCSDVSRWVKLHAADAAWSPCR
jgi:hypothetical protein